MNEEARKELKTILASYKAKLVDRNEREAHSRLARASFIEQFRTLKAEMIGPVLNEFAVQLNGEGHAASVIDQQEPSDLHGHFIPSSVALRVVPAKIGDAPGVQTGGAVVDVTFSANQHAMKVLVSSSNNAQGSSGKRGEYDLSELTEDFVVSNVLRTIRGAFAGANESSARG
jgi:hypothetical protein